MILAKASNKRQWSIRFGLRFWSFATLCLLVASRWLFENMQPAMASTYRSQALGCGLAALLPVALLARGLHPARTARIADLKHWLPRASACTVVLSAPAIASAFAPDPLHSNDATTAMLLCPVVVAVVVVSRSRSSDTELTGLLWPGLMGLVALLLLLPQPSYAHVGSWIALSAMPLLVGLAAGFSRREGSSPQERSFAASAPIVFIGLLLAAAFFAVLSWKGSSIAGSKLAFSAAALDGSTALLTLLSLSTLGPLRWSSQFLLIPLLGLLEGIALLHPAVDARSWLALGLLCISGGYQLLFTPASS